MTSPNTSLRPGPNGLYDPANEHDACGVGFIANIKGRKSHTIVADALTMLTRMDHRGACGCETNTGDGAGILAALPVGLLREEAQFDVPDTPFAAGNVFLPTNDEARANAKAIVERVLHDRGLAVLGWRPLPTDPDHADIGPSARMTQPVMEQLFVAPPATMNEETFEQSLFLARKQATLEIRGRVSIEQAEMFYVCSLSARIIVYKGQLTAPQVPLYYPDLRDQRFTSHLAMVHSRFSTNTFPSWDRAQPCRWMSHNGEINTLRGNSNWLRARAGAMNAEPGSVVADLLDQKVPIIDDDLSDSGTFDTALELLVMAGRSLPEAVMMMIPEAWENHESMPVQKRAFYEFHANLMEPWDGPASISFTDGRYIGAVLDRNGLRPSRYYVTNDDRVVMASEVGVIDIPEEQVRAKGRLEPGRMFLVDFDKGQIIDDAELKGQIASKRPYGQWLQNQKIEISDLPVPPLSERERVSMDNIIPVLRAFGYTTEHLNMIMAPMVQKGMEPTGSMGNDAALAVLSDKPRLIYDYFKQLFAQVTNPPIDPIREEIIMSLEGYIGPEGNLLETTEAQAHRLHLPQPILRNSQMSAIKKLNYRGWTSRIIDITYDREGGTDAMTAALDRVCEEAVQAVNDNIPLVILSDRPACDGRIPLSALLATGAVHQHLVRNQLRTRIGLVVESAEPREIHHFCTLIGYGADAINPYLAIAALRWMNRQGLLDLDAGIDDLVAQYIKAIGKGILKVMSKMGISTLASYKGAQIFECVGLRDQVIDRCFTGTASRLQGVGFDVLAEEAARRHNLGYPKRATVRFDELPNPGEYHWRPQGERHALPPTAIANVQRASRENSSQAYDDYARMTNDDSRTRCTLRGLMRLKTDPDKAIPLDEVEPASEIVKRFRTGAMSLGALSQEAHETLALAMNRIGGMSNSGEGGEDPQRFKILNNGDSKRSAIKQIASGRFGVTSYYLANADMLQIKIAQGAKPGEGGQLPGFKVNDYIAKIRYSTPGVGLISPPPHHDIYSIEDLAQLIFDLKNANPAAGVSVKLVAEVGVGTVAAGVAKAHADHILVSGFDGGTGASPMTSIKHAGLPWELGIAETHQTLVLNDLRSRVRLETDGGMRTGRDLFVAACLGAEEYGFSTLPLIAVGCIMMRKCHLNTCPVGVCTQDPLLRKKFAGQPEHVINFLFLVAEEARGYMAAAGVRTIDELIGRTDLLDTRQAINHWKADGLDLTAILKPATRPAHRENVGIRKLIEQDHGLDKVLDQTLIKLAQPAITNRENVEIHLPIRNTDRAVGAMLSHEVSRNQGEAGLPDDTVRVGLRGHAGQSFGAFLTSGVTLRLEGDANDYVGKGLSGGKIIVTPPEGVGFEPEHNIIAGNVCLYGATGGEVYLRGIVAERFAVRNSGAHAVVEGVGDHGCEYMTDGRVVILGRTGRNFAAGMSGGIAYIWDRDGDLLQHCNLGMVELEKLDEPEDVTEVKDLIRRHLEYTGSTVAARVLSDFDRLQTQFVKVMPIDYRRVLLARKAAARAQQEASGLG
ncbi:glutamate synthase large subunit [Mucisphaera calidilacus]|uniref:Ferredoxin-dependent glutamate synthase 1 n=1 Tax=Mucisphaera calidilacus TaxID=2527982 RepID=A0A518C121_9BACT|nr:glutamate synthase large subunit [Mucisphaera calidilacus]QDU72919.1 Ferredoxin-dependent glutamate synthase 1 [Mucisphaera calidilacus]